MDVEGYFIETPRMFGIAVSDMVTVLLIINTGCLKFQDKFTEIFRCLRKVVVKDNLQLRY